ncbi:hypothetical protein HN51_062968 [Arachis hypogaea]|nr:Branched-chain-amino-acid aminotransferase [Arachis hypogaea]
MKAGADRLCMTSPSVERFINAVKDTVLANKRWVPPAGRGTLYLRPLLMATGAALGMGPSTEYTFLIYCSPVSNYHKKEKPGTLLPNFSLYSSSLDNIISNDESTEAITCMELETYRFDIYESMEEKSLVEPEVETTLWATCSETESYTSNYEIGRSSPTGATFLECLFPLYSPKSGFRKRYENFLFFTQPAKVKAEEDVDEEGANTWRTNHDE